jgi:hypothetical protein
MEEPMVKRKQKVYYLQYEDTWNRFTPQPMIRIAGKYLKKFNFNIGDQIEIDVSTDKIEIRRVTVPVKQEE